MSKLLLIAVLLLTILGGCPDPQARFDDFARRVPDAAHEVHIDAMPLPSLPDVNGDFLMGMSVPISPDQWLRFHVHDTLVANTDGTGTITMSIQPLSAMDHVTLVGPALVPPAADVNIAGEFDVEFTDVVIPGAANPITGSDVTVTLTLHGQIRTQDLVCGDVPVGNITMPVMLSAVGTTWSQVRIPAGGPDPTIEVKCPATGGDAGPIDAAAPASDATP